MGSRVGMDAVEKRKISAIVANQTNFTVVQRTAKPLYPLGYTNPIT
jgi:hypothetical protein